MCPATNPVAPVTRTGPCVQTSTAAEEANIGKTIGSTVSLRHTVTLTLKKRATQGTHIN